MLLLREKKQMRSKIPNIITLLNLFCGCCALVCIFKLMFIPAFIFLMVGGIADYTDGMVARALGVNSPFGKEIDSLADMVSFGVVPGAILYQLLSISWYGTAGALEATIVWEALPGFLVSIFACWRLAKFNLDTRQSENFIGLPTPSATMFVCGLMLIYEQNSEGMREWILQPYFLYAVALAFSYLLISEIPMKGFKFKSFAWQGNEFRYIFVILSVLLLLVVKEIAFSVLILVYVIYSIITFVLKKDKHEVLS